MTAGALDFEQSGPATCLRCVGSSSASPSGPQDGAAGTSTEYWKIIWITGVEPAYTSNPAELHHNKTGRFRKNFVR